jgi:Fe-S-cluster-containing dehydrogenase component
MSLDLTTPRFLIERNKDRCIDCKVCVTQCANEAHYYDEEEEIHTTDIKLNSIRVEGDLIFNIE